MIAGAEETESNISRCGDKDFLPVVVAQEIADGYVNLKKAVFGYIRFLNSNFN